jgi:hypothetical protein
MEIHREEQILRSYSGQPSPPKKEYFCSYFNTGPVVNQQFLKSKASTIFKSESLQVVFVVKSRTHRALPFELHLLNLCPRRQTLRISCLTQDYMLFSDPTEHIELGPQEVVLLEGSFAPADALFAVPTLELLVGPPQQSLVLALPIYFTNFLDESYVSLEVVRKVAAQPRASILSTGWISEGVSAASMCRAISQRFPTAEVGSSSETLALGFYD